MDVAALLLTGGASMRMGRPKAGLGYGATTLARHLAGLLAESARGPFLEVGPGWTDLAAVADEHPGQGPLAAVASGVGALRERGWTGPALVVATDLPRLTGSFVRWLVDHPAPGSVVPVDAEGYPQWLCARYASPALDDLRTAAAGGERSVRRVLGGSAEVLLVTPDHWSLRAGPDAVADVDRPADLPGTGVAMGDIR